jgi:hypothetical protein
MANIFSMTGYGKGEYNDGKRSITAEIKTGKLCKCMHHALY